MSETPSSSAKPGSDCCCKGSSRRGFFLTLGVGLNVVAGSLLAVPILGYVLSSLRRPPSAQWISLGPVGGFPSGTTRLATYRNPVHRPWDGKTADIPCWVRSIDGSKFQVFAINCAHLGCPVRWFEQSRLFLCPCHGGAYYEDGSRASGPPPRGLFEYEYKVEKGDLWVKGGFIPTLARPLSAA